MTDFFTQTDNDRYTIIPTANVSIVSDFIMPNSAESPQDSASVSVILFMFMSAVNQKCFIRAVII